MKVKIIITVILALIFFFVASYLYKFLLILVALLVWRRNMPKIIFYGSAAVIAFFIFDVFPNNREVYYVKDKKVEKRPISDYLLESLIPEEEILNLSVTAVKTLPPSMLPKSKMFDLARTESMDRFFKPYNYILSRHNRKGSLAITQLIRHSVNPIYISNWGSPKKKPIVIFLHGFAGNWELYKYILNVPRCVCVHYGTKDISGIYTADDIRQILDVVIPFVKENYDVDDTQIHLIGLSNGGSGANIAANSFGNRFKSVTFLSTPCHLTSAPRCQIYMIGGAKDGNCQGFPKGPNTLLFPDEDHFAFVNKSDEIRKFFMKKYGIEIEDDQYFEAD